MVTTDFSGRDSIKVLRTHGDEITGRSGSHVQRRSVTDGSTVRNVTVPLYDQLGVSLLRTIANQCGANDFQAWCEWIDRHRRCRPVARKRPR
ncbi:MAG: type II toxin-antitoxin system HicA family toxin [Halobacteriales archaeon]